MKNLSVYDRIRNRTQPETTRFVERNLEVLAEINRLMKAKGWTQKDLAREIGKTESEISKWLSGLHNLTLKSIAKLEVVLDAELLTVPKPVQSAQTMHRFEAWTITKKHTYSTLSARQFGEEVPFCSSETTIKIMAA